MKSLAKKIEKRRMKEMKRNHKLYEWAFACRIKIQWKPNHTKEKRSLLNAVDEGCSIEEISWDIFQLVKWMKQADREKEQKEPEQYYYTIRPAKYIFLLLLDREY